uniref:transcription factor bHLH113-like n=1 Tax=Erigeron canadensis TaxID=72917 RepID=UPI001CB965F3|nr:transcription factor bHLH113-like [Erigeron canadensis]
MPQNEAAAAIDPIVGGTFSRLLFSDLDDVTPSAGHHFTFSSDKQDVKPPKMLCFATDNYNYSQNSVTDDSSSPSSTTNSTITSLSSNSNMKRNMGCDIYQTITLPTNVTPIDGGATAAPVKTIRRNNKKAKVENMLPASHAKVKKEKLGERIAALQQIVSPYGKTDTASVLHEAFGYIKFLHEQVHVLCSPYLKRLPTTHIEGQEDGGGQRKRGLKNRGLCLVPVEGTLHVAESNGADMWSNAMGNRHGASLH